MSLTFGMTSENSFATSASVRDRLSSILAMLNMMEGLARRIQDPQHLGANVALELMRTKQFTFRLLKDLELADRAAATPRKDERP